MAQQVAHSGRASTYLGFDRNDYPGDQVLEQLRQTFAYTGFWLNHPPGEKTNSWAGKRQILQSAGFGFLVLFNGRLSAVLNVLERSPAGQVRRPGSRGLRAARRFSVRSDHLPRSGRGRPDAARSRRLTFTPGWTVSPRPASAPAFTVPGIAAKEDGGVSIITAEDIRQNAAGREIAFWVANDGCPPSPGCAFPRRAPSPAESGIEFAAGWQFAHLRSGGTSRPGVRPTPAPTEVAIPLESIPPGICTWM